MIETTREFPNNLRRGGGCNLKAVVTGPGFASRRGKWPELFLDRDPTMTRADFGSFSVQPGQHEEGELTKRIEHFTSQVPSGAYLSLAIGSIGLSALLYLNGRKTDASFVGHWVPTILMLGIYNKMVKQHGSD